MIETHHEARYPVDELIKNLTISPGQIFAVILFQENMNKSNICKQL
jgi:hypothetical protein